MPAKVIRSKLNSEQRQNIQKLYHSYGLSAKNIAQRYECSPSLIFCIISGFTNAEEYARASKDEKYNRRAEFRLIYGPRP